MNIDKKRQGLKFKQEDYKRIKGLFICFCILSSLFLLASCSSQEDMAVRKPAIIKGENYYPSSELTVLLLPADRPKEIYERFLFLKYYLQNSIKRPIRIKIAKNYDAAISEIGNGNISLAFLDPSTYCEVRAKYKKKVLPLVKPFGNKGSTSRSVLVVKANSGIDNVADLRGKRLALGSIRSSFSYLMPLSILQAVNLKIKDFSTVDFLEQEDRIALSVLVGYYDVGALSENIAKKYTGEGLKIIKVSEAIPPFVLCASSSLSGDLRSRISDSLISLKDKKILSVIDPNIEGFVLAEDRDFDVVRVMIKNLTGRDYIEYGEKTIKVAVLPLYSEITLYDRYEPLMRYLSNKTGYEFKLIIPRDFEDFVNIVKNKQVDFSYQNPYVFAMIDKDADIKPIATTVGEDIISNEMELGDKFRGVIITRQDSPIKDIKDLRKRKVMITSYKSAGGYLSQKLFLNQFGIDTERDMKLIDAKKQENVILGVYRGEADAGFVRESAMIVWKDIVDMKKIRILTKTLPLPNWPFAAVKNPESQLSKDVKNYLLKLNDESVLRAAKIKGFKEALESDFEWLKRY
jgi:phosphate/phosphite/phosphonate ABC transporter binding protein